MRIKCNISCKGGRSVDTSLYCTCRRYYYIKLKVKADDIVVLVMQYTCFSKMIVFSVTDISIQDYEGRFKEFLHTHEYTKDDGTVGADGVGSCFVTCYSVAGKGSVTRFLVPFLPSLYKNRKVHQVMHVVLVHLL